MARPLVCVDNAVVHYGQRCALDRVSVDLTSGATVAVIGPNGSGKSTLLRAIAGLATLTSGSVTAVGTSIAVVLQATDVDRSLPITVTETVRMARYADRGMLGRLRKSDHDVVANALERLDVADLARRQLHELSGGQRQRVLVAQGLAQQADVLLLDEPVTGLDLVSRQIIFEVIAAERAAGHAVAMTTHGLDDARTCDEVVLLSTRCIAKGTPAEVIGEDNLRAAFGGRVLALDDGDFVMDDPHHH